ncbi:MAG: general secretion pathway protein GspK [Synergistaceae bacterium]|jgi:type II secretory pathway component PulK|nr:general secretion pathway protein GspK [Synergistaceae bacterium]
MRKCCRASESGFILAAILLVTALFLGAAVSFALFARYEAARVSAEEFAAVTRGLAMSALREATDAIALDDGPGDSGVERIYSGKPVELDFSDFTARITIEPLDGRIPINDLLLPDGVTIKNEYAYPFALAMEALGMERLAPVILDFIDADATARAGGRESGDFPNRRLSDLSELLRLPEISGGVLYSNGTEPALEDFFTVRGDAGININTAPGRVIAILDPGLGADTAARIVESRAENAINGPDDLLKIPGISNTVITRLKNVINYKSVYFRVHIEVVGRNRGRNFEITVRREQDGCSVINWRE